jgi:hypothetical protein
MLLALHQIQAGKVEKTQNPRRDNLLKSPRRLSLHQSVHKSPQTVARFLEEASVILSPDLSGRRIPAVAFWLQ